MDSRDDFCLLLPSDSNMDKEPENKPSQYIVHLRTPRVLGDYDSLGWEVAIKGFDYTHTGFGRVDDTCIRVLFTLTGRPRQIFPSEAKPPYLMAYSPSDKNTVAAQIAWNERPDARRILSRIAGYNRIDRNVLIARNLDKLGADVTNRSLYYKIAIPSSTPCSSIADLCIHICEQFDNAFKHHYNVTLTYSIDSATGRVTFAVTPTDQVKVTFLVTNQYLSNILGMQTEEACNFRIGLLNFKMLRMRLVGSSRAVLPKLHSFFIYTDLTEHTAVGDSDVPLLGVVPIQGDLGERQHFTFTAPTYLMVNKSHIKTVLVQICNERGDQVAFPVNADPVLCHLHFRRHKPRNR
jgi:hypothetical protein